MRQLQKAVADALGMLFQSRKYPKVIQSYQQASDALLSTKAAYIVAASYRALGCFNEAQKLYNMIVQFEENEPGLRGLSFYHLAHLTKEKGEKMQAIEFSKKCLTLIPDHEKCKELLQEVASL